MRGNYSGLYRSRQVRIGAETNWAWSIEHGGRSQEPESRRISKTTVIPAKAGIQLSLDSRLRGNDGLIILPSGLQSSSRSTPRLARLALYPMPILLTYDDNNFFSYNFAVLPYYQFYAVFSLGQGSLSVLDASFIHS